MSPLVQGVYATAFTLTFCAKTAAEYRLTGDRSVAHRQIKGWAEDICRLVHIDVKAFGVEAVDWTRPHVIMANHQSYLDILALYRALPIIAGMVAKKELYRIPALGQIMHSIGCVPIDRGDGQKAQEAIRKAAREVQSGQTLFIFPEGTRSPGDRILPLKKGGFYLVEEAQAPIVPIGIRGAAKLMPRDTYGIKSGVVEVHVGAPLKPPAERGSSARDRMRADVRRALGRLAALPLVPETH